jgi:threonine/homoserine efflux transporter RhtA
LLAVVVFGCERAVTFTGDLAALLALHRRHNAVMKVYVVIAGLLFFMLAVLALEPRREVAAVLRNDFDDVH